MFDANRTRGLVRALAVLGAASVASVAGAQVVLPHAFSPGTPARANEVNANFAALRDGVNAHDQAIADLGTLVQNLDIQVQNLDAQVQALDAEVQSLAQAATGPRGVGLEIAGTVQGTVVHVDTQYGTVTALNDMGWIIAVEGGEHDSPFAEGELLTVTFFYTGLNCTGNPYVANNPASDGFDDYEINPSTSIFYFRTGMVVGSPAAPRQAYMIQGTPSPAVLLSARNAYDPCYNLLGPYTTPAIPIQPNNPSTTGVPDVLGGPIRLVPR